MPDLRRVRAGAGLYVQHVREVGVMRSTMTYGDILAANLRAARAVARLHQETVAERMRKMGYSAWRYQTVGQAEHGKRRVTVEEIIALALAFGTTVPALMSPSLGIQTVLLPSGDTIPAETIRGLCRGGFAFPVNWGDGDRVA